MWHTFSRFIIGFNNNVLLLVLDEFVANEMPIIISLILRFADLD